MHVNGIRRVADRVNAAPPENKEPIAVEMLHSIRQVSGRDAEHLFVSAVGEPTYNFNSPRWGKYPTTI
jgi:hypothetical protein